MKTKSFIFIGVFFLSFSMRIFSQSYVPFPTNNVFWTITRCFSAGGFNQSALAKITISGDTTIHSNNYHKLVFQDRWVNNYGCSTCNFLYDTNAVSYYLGSFREFGKKIYFVPEVPASGDPIGTEYVIYDFNISGVGDTVTVHALEFYPFHTPAISSYDEILHDEESYVVQSIDSVIMSDGSYRKRYRFDPFHLESWIEGIGTTKGFSSFFHVTDNFDGLLCYSSNGVHLTSIPGVNCGISSYSCEQTLPPIITSINEIEKQKSIEYFPNPTDEGITIKGMLPGETLNIYNTSGELVLVVNVNSTILYVSFEKLSSGIYIGRIFNSENLNVRNFKVLKTK